MDIEKGFLTFVGQRIAGKLGLETGAEFCVYLES
jgi:hypothetical protein